MNGEPMRFDGHDQPGLAALMLIDIQMGFGVGHWNHWAGPGGRRNNPDAELVAGRLLTFWRAQRCPVIHVRHDSLLPTSPLRPGQPGNDFSTSVKPAKDEAIYSKTVNSAFIGTSLERDLREQGIDTLIIAGIQTDQCVSSTVRMAGNLGFVTFVVADACATFDRAGFDGRHFAADVIHDISLASLHREFATVVTAADIARPWGR